MPRRLARERPFSVLSAVLCMDLLGCCLEAESMPLAAWIAKM